MEKYQDEAVVQEKACYAIRRLVSGAMPADQKIRASVIRHHQANTNTPSLRVARDPAPLSADPHTLYY
ncbi:MAG: hypothetical protein ACK51L_04135 [bacterium]